jgi:hypothetical protein
MKIFVSNNVVLFILIVTTTIDASRILYLPLPKLHSSHKQIQEETTKKPISDEYIPSSVLEQEEIEKRGDSFDWEELVDKRTEEIRTVFDEHLSENLQQQSDAEPWVVESAVERFERLQATAELNSLQRQKRRNDTLFIVVVGTCCVVGVVGLVAAAIFWYKIQKRAEAATVAEYPSYGVTGPNSSGSKISPSSTMSDRKLAQSAQMFHYQQQRQQMMAQEKAHLDTKPVHSDDSDDEAPAGGDYTVYECPGLAPTGEMEVRNPLFAEHESSLTLSPTSSHPPTNNHFPQLSTSPPKEKSLP